MKHEDDDSGRGVAIAVITGLILVMYFSYALALRAMFNGG